MNMPGFTAEGSLYKSRGYYVGRNSFAASAGGELRPSFRSAFAWPTVTIGTIGAQLKTPPANLAAWTVEAEEAEAEAAEAVAEAAQ